MWATVPLRFTSARTDERRRCQYNIISQTRDDIEQFSENLHGCSSRVTHVDATTRSPPEPRGIKFCLPVKCVNAWRERDADIKEKLVRVRWQKKKKQNKKEEKVSKSSKTRLMWVMYPWIGEKVTPNKGTWHIILSRDGCECFLLLLFTFYFLDVNLKTMHIIRH